MLNRFFDFSQSVVSKSFINYKMLKIFKFRFLTKKHFASLEKDATFALRFGAEKASGNAPDSYQERKFKQ